MWPPASFYLSRDGTSTGFVDSKLQFVDWEGKQITATPWIPNANVTLSTFSNLHVGMGPMTVNVNGSGATVEPSLISPGPVVPIDIVGDSPFDEIAPAKPISQTPVQITPIVPPTSPPADSIQAGGSGSGSGSSLPQPAKTQVPKLEGWLHKRGDVGIVLDWTWKQRYFRENEDGKLYYFDDRNTTSPSDSKGKIDLAVVTKIEVNPSMNLGFNIVTPGRTYVLRATSKADLHYWTTNLPLKCPKITPSPNAGPGAVTRAASSTGLVVNSMGNGGTTSSTSATTTTTNGSTTTTTTTGTATTTTTVSTSTAGAAPGENRISPSQIAYGQNGAAASADISALRSSIRNASFSRDKIAIIQSSANTRSFSCSQVFELLKELPFSEDKHEACIALYPKITDTGNFSVVLEAFDFSSDKDRVKKALGLM